MRVPRGLTQLSHILCGDMQRVVHLFGGTSLSSRRVKWRDLRRFLAPYGLLAAANNPTDFYRGLVPMPFSLPATQFIRGFRRLGINLVGYGLIGAYLRMHQTFVSCLGGQEVN